MVWLITVCDFITSLHSLAHASRSRMDEGASQWSLDRAEGPVWVRPVVCCNTNVHHAVISLWWVRYLKDILDWDRLRLIHPWGGRYKCLIPHTKMENYIKLILKSNSSVKIYANILKLPFKHPVVFLLTFNPFSFGIRKIISQIRFKELSFSWSDLDCFSLPDTCIGPCSSSISGWSHWNGHLLIRWHLMPASQHFRASCMGSKSGSYTSKLDQLDFCAPSHSLMTQN